VVLRTESGRRQSCCLEIFVCAWHRLSTCQLRDDIATYLAYLSVEVQQMYACRDVGQQIAASDEVKVTQLRKQKTSDKEAVYNGSNGE
jgi:hypothetical protein